MTSCKHGTTSVASAISQTEGAPKLRERRLHVQHTQHHEGQPRSPENDSEPLAGGRQGRRKWAYQKKRPPCQADNRTTVFGKFCDKHLSCWHRGVPKCGESRHQTHYSET
jgi:hypothetical protein